MQHALVQTWPQVHRPESSEFVVIVTAYGDQPGWWMTPGA
jgi:hypothetical protein